MANVKTSVSIQKPLLKRVETLARKLKISRSHLISLALEEYIRRYDNSQLLQEVNAAYQGAPDASERQRLNLMRRHHCQHVEGEWKDN